MFKGCAVWGVADPHAVFGKEEVVEPPVRHGAELPVWNRGKKNPSPSDVRGMASGQRARSSWSWRAGHIG